MTKDISDIIATKKQLSNVFPQDIEKYLVLRDRYLPVLYVEHKFRLIKKDISLDKIFDDDYVLYENYNHLYEKKYCNFHCSPTESSVGLFFADVKENKILLSPTLASEAQELLQGLIKKKTTPKPLKEFLRLKPTLQFMDEINEHFQKGGFSNLKVVAAYPTNFIGEVIMLDDYDDTSEFGYFLNITYKGEGYLGVKGGKNPNAYVVVRPDFSLIQSTWCQHLTRWSKKVDIVDQDYKVWDILDWLTGPYAERIKTSLDEAPFIFMGAKPKKTKDAKKQIIEKLKKQMAQM